MLVRKICLRKRSGVHLKRDEHEVEQVKEAAGCERAELEEPYGGVAEVESIESEYAAEHREQERRVVTVAGPSGVGNERRYCTCKYFYIK